MAGRVVEEGSSFGISGVIVRFYTAAGALAGQASTNSTGNFTTNIQSTATQLHVDATSIPLGYHRSYTYQSKIYSPLISTCKAPLPALGAGTTTVPTILIPSAGTPPPPPPTGCR